MRYRLILLLMLLASVTSAPAQVSVGVGVPGLSIGINVPVYPELVRVPGYPVYYAPRLAANYFFYDGMYWVYQGDNWYASSWYNGPWSLVAPEVVPLYVLRIPVRYYRQPPVYFRGWQRDAPPRWGEHWGHDWTQRRGGWDRWDRRFAPGPAALPLYQRQYSGDRYPRIEQQPSLHGQHYRYQPRDAYVREQYRQLRPHGAYAAPERGPQGRPQTMGPGPQRMQSPQALPSPLQGGRMDRRAERPEPEDRGPQRRDAQREPDRRRGEGPAMDREKSPR